MTICHLPLISIFIVLNISASKSLKITLLSVQISFYQSLVVWQVSLLIPHKSVKDISNIIITQSPEESNENRLLKKFKPKPQGSSRMKFKIAKETLRFSLTSTIIISFTPLTILEIKKILCLLYISFEI